jgi:hypothetical protein
MSLLSLKFSGLNLTIFPPVKKVALTRGAQKLTGDNLKTCLGQVFNYKLGCFEDVHLPFFVDACPILGSRESAPTNNREQAQTSERLFSFSRRARALAGAP